MKKEVSLNYEVRKQEQEEREQRRVARTKIEDRVQSEQDTASAPKADKTQDHFWDELKDAYLKESIRLLAQQIELTGQKSPK